MVITLADMIGYLGIIVSIFVYLAPMVTFHRIYKRRSTEGFQSVPYSAALFSAMLFLYYAFLKRNAMVLTTINSIGCALESAYLLMYIAFAPKKARATTLLTLLLSMVSLGAIIACTHFLVFQHDQRMRIVGWICAAFNVGVFAAPLAIMRKVIKTKSVEYMPFALSFLHTICSFVWSIYGILIGDYYVAVPNMVGFVFGVAQIILYFVYKKIKCLEQQIPPKGVEDVATELV